LPTETIRFVPSQRKWCRSLLTISTTLCALGIFPSVLAANGVMCINVATWRAKRAVPRAQRAEPETGFKRPSTLDSVTTLSDMYQTTQYMGPVTAGLPFPDARVPAYATWVIVPHDLSSGVSA
jgi:hypothetical protein